MQDLPIGTRVNHPKYGEGIVSQSKLSFFEIFFERAGKTEITKYNSDLKVVEMPPVETTREGLTLEEVDEAISLVLSRFQDIQPIVPLGERWIGGTMTLSPSDQEKQSKEIPLETFFHKIVMLRDRLRVLEQNINSHAKLNDEEKVHLQQYITRAYGSLTSFNILFADKEDHFKGHSKK